MTAAGPTPLTACFRKPSRPTPRRLLLPSAPPPSSACPAVPRRSNTKRPTANGTPRPPPAATVPRPTSRTRRNAALRLFFEHATACQLGLITGNCAIRGAPQTGSQRRCECNAVEDRMRRFAQIGLLACFFRSGGRHSPLLQTAAPQNPPPRPRLVPSPRGPD